VQEFWGRRWNLTVSAWLAETFFRPLARRGKPLLGVFVAFFVSAMLHAYICEAAMGLGMAAMMLAYFGVQGAIVGIELLLGVARWGPYREGLDLGVDGRCLAGLHGASPPGHGRLAALRVMLFSNTGETFRAHSRAVALLDLACNA